MAIRLELGDVDRSTAGLSAFEQRRQADQATLPAGAGARAVQHDAEHPGDDARSALKPVNSGKHREPRVLHDLLGLGPAADDRGSDADQRGVKAPDQRSIGLFVALAQPCQE